jgi:hypothetical protein
VFGGDQGDKLLVNDGDGRDVAKGGAGRDVCLIDEGDRAVNCEEVRDNVGAESPEIPEDIQAEDIQAEDYLEVWGGPGLETSLGPFSLPGTLRGGGVLVEYRAMRGHVPGYYVGRADRGGVPAA